MKAPLQAPANKKQERQFPAAQSADKNQSDNSVASQILAQTAVNQSPYAQEMMSYQQMANNSPRVKEAAALQAMADRSPQVQAAIQMQTAADAYVQANDPFNAQTLSNNQASLQGQTSEKTENRTGLPDRLKFGVESLSGISIDDVRVHYNSSKPAQLNALAYAQGTDIHVAPGQERHLPHEAWHVIQQKQGRVKATTQMKGIGVNDDVGLEREATLMGNRVDLGTKDLAQQITKSGEGRYNTRNQIRKGTIQRLKRELNAKSARDTDFKEENEEGNPKNAATGKTAINEIWKIKYKFGVEKENGKEYYNTEAQQKFEGFFKPNDAPIKGYEGTRAAATGIPKDNSQLDKRSIATYRVDQQLKTNLIPGTYFAHHKKDGYIMESYGDKPGAWLSDVKEKTYDKGSVRKRLSNLYLLDFITGQADRHSGNVRVEIDKNDEDESALDLKGIDNDFSFGKDYLKRVDWTKAEHTPQTQATIAGLTPPMIKEIDQEFADEIIKIAKKKDQEIKDDFQLEDLLSSDEIDAFIKRIRELADYLNSDKAKGNTKSNWSDELDDPKKAIRAGFSPA